MLKIKKKIESVMHSADQIPVSPLASMLYGISVMYGAAQKLRASCYRSKVLGFQKLPCRVISVGNITVGGTGKTPMTIYVAQKLQQSGLRVAVISRGYKGRAESGGGVVSDGRNLLMDSEQAGDEPYLMAGRLKNIPVIVGKNRFAAGMLAISKFQSEVIVLDDAFQHLKLSRDIDLILLDYTRPFGNTHLLPRGILREPVTALRRATACILTRSPTGMDEAASTTLAGIKTHMPDIPIFTSSHDPYMYTVKSGVPTPFNAISHFIAPPDPDQIKYKKVYGFSGIARNDDFQRTVATLGFNPVGFFEFSDHHNYSRDDLEKMVRIAQEAGTDCLITTEKDHARIAHQKPLSMDLIVIGVKIDFGNDEQEFISFIQSRLQQ
ncbi:tetraacyldisaccharide 4'-kinase [Thermodesulfobacteriota bacterium]